MDMPACVRSIFRTSGPRELRKRVLPRLLQPLLHSIGPRVTCVAQRAWLLSSSFSSFSMQCDVSILCVCARAMQDLKKLSKKELIDRIEKAAEVLLVPEGKALDAAAPDKKDAAGKALEAAVLAERLEHVYGILGHFNACMNV